MTKVMLTRQEDGSLYFDCLNHSGNNDVCTIMSTLCNVIVVAAMKYGYDPAVYEPGHVTVIMEIPPFSLVSTVEAVMDVIKVVQEQNPENVKIY